MFPHHLSTTVISFSSINPQRYGHNKEIEADSSLNSEAVRQKKAQDYGLVWKRVGANKEQAHDPSSYTLPVSKTPVNNHSRWRHSLKK